MAKTSSGVTVSAVVPADLAPRIQALRVEGPNIFSASTVLRAAILRGIIQLERERSEGRSILAEPTEDR